MGGFSREMDRLIADAYQKGYEDGLARSVQVVYKNSELDAFETARRFGRSKAWIEEQLKRPESNPTRYQFNDWVREPGDGDGTHKMRISRVYNGGGSDIVYFAQDANQDGVRHGIERMFYEDELIPEPDIPEIYAPRRYKLQHTCPHCREEHQAWTISLTKEEQAQIDKYYEEHKNQSIFERLIRASEEPPLIVQRHLTCGCCHKEFDADLLVCDVDEVGFRHPDMIPRD